MQLINTCRAPRQATPDGLAGQYAGFYLIGYQYGYWFANGQILNPAGQQLPQVSSRTLSGISKPDIFHKSAGVCIAPQVVDAH